MSPRKSTAEERLASEPPTSALRSSRASATAFVALAAAVVAAGNVAASVFANPPWLSPDRRIIGTKFEVARARAADLVIVGDSSAAFGVNARVLGEALGRSAVNLATFGRFEVAGSAWTLDEYLAHHPAPAVVVAMHGARTWWLEASGLDLSQLPLEAGYWTRREPRRSLELGTLAEFALGRYAPLYTQSAGFARGLRGRGFGVPDLPAIEADGTLAIGPEEARWANPRAFLDRTVLPELAERSARNATLPALQLAATEALAARAERDGFELVFVAAPQWDVLATIPAHAALVAEVEAHLSALAARHSRVHLVPGGPRLFATSEVENPYHLQGAAAEAYTRTLAEDLRAWLPAR